MSFVTKRVENLNSNYKRALKLSYIIVLLLVIAAFKFTPQSTGPQQIKPPDNNIPVIPEIDPTNQPSQPPPPRPPVPIAAALNDEIVDIILPSTDINPDENVPVVPLPPKPPVIKDEVVPYYLLESVPEPVGGMKAIGAKIHYTELARRAGIEGTVTIEAVLDKEGNVVQAFVKKGIGGGLDEIALQAVRDTKFIPGKQRGKPVKVNLSIPVRFRLQ